jgi:hypothetical protein
MLSRPFAFTYVSLAYVPQRLGIVLWKCLGVRPENILKNTFKYVGEDVVFSDPYCHRNNKHAKTVYVKNKQGQPLIFTTPKTKIHCNQNNDKNRCAVCVDQGASEMRKFLGFLEDFDNKVKAEALSGQWFGKHLTPVTIGKMYYPSTTLVSGEHIIRYKFPDDVHFFDNNINPIGPDHIKRGGQLRAIIFPLVWMLGDKFGVSWRIMQGMVWEPQRRFPGPQAFPKITASLSSRGEGGEK